MHQGLKQNDLTARRQPRRGRLGRAVLDAGARAPARPGCPVQKQSGSAQRAIGAGPHLLAVSQATEGDETNESGVMVNGLGDDDGSQFHAWLGESPARRAERSIRSSSSVIQLRQQREELNDSRVYYDGTNSCLEDSNLSVPGKYACGSREKGDYIPTRTSY